MHGRQLEWAELLTRCVLDKAAGGFEGAVHSLLEEALCEVLAAKISMGWLPLLLLHSLQPSALMQSSNGHEDEGIGQPSNNFPDDLQRGRAFLSMLLMSLPNDCPHIKAQQATALISTCTGSA